MWRTLHTEICAMYSNKLDLIHIYSEQKSRPPAGGSRVTEVLYKNMNYAITPRGGGRMRSNCGKIILMI